MKALLCGVNLSEVGFAAGQRASPELPAPSGLASPLLGTPGAEPTLRLAFDTASHPSNGARGHQMKAPAPAALSPARPCPRRRHRSSRRTLLGLQRSSGLAGQGFCREPWEDFGTEPHLALAEHPARSVC